MRPLRIDPNDRPTIVVEKPRRQRRESPAPEPRRAPASGPRRRFLVPWRKLGWAAAAVAVVALAGGAWQAQRNGLWAGLWTGGEHAVGGVMAAAGLTVQAINVEGRRGAAPTDLLQAIGARQGDPILFVDLEAARKRVEALGWVRSATVERRLPDTLHIRLVERAAFARWQLDGKTVLIDRGGVVLTREDPEDYRHLRRVVGPGAAAKAGELFDMMVSEPGLFGRVTNAVRVRTRRWDIEFDNGVVVRLPEDGVAAAWHRLAELDRKERLLDRDIAAIDLRLPDRLVVRLTPEAAAGKRAPGRST